MKSVIWLHYNMENNPYKRVVKILRTEHGFSPTYYSCFLCNRLCNVKYLELTLIYDLGGDNFIARLMSGVIRRISKNGKSATSSTLSITQRMNKRILDKE